MITTHVLKTWPDSFGALWSGAKTAEYRRNDRAFAVGDRLVLRETTAPHSEAYTGRTVHATITHVLHGGRFGIPEPYCMLSFNVTNRVELAVPEASS